MIREENPINPERLSAMAGLDFIDENWGLRRAVLGLAETGL